MKVIKLDDLKYILNGKINIWAEMELKQVVKEKAFELKKAVWEDGSNAMGWIVKILNGLPLFTIEIPEVKGGKND